MTETAYRIQGNTGEWEVVIGLEVGGFVGGVGDHGNRCKNSVAKSVSEIKSKRSRAMRCRDFCDAGC